MVLTLPGSSYRGPFQVDQPAAFIPNSPPLTSTFFWGRAQHTSMAETDNAQRHSALMGKFTGNIYWSIVQANEEGREHSIFPRGAVNLL